LREIIAVNGLTTIPFRKHIKTDALKANAGAGPGIFAEQK